ncbi:hypothetical protein HELRODRAFT_157354 [Helobdella robusta]|uniref:Uncharacterized protein n=1 Tax=Helobdella robusta TaxID=6412 RepID=T1EMA1_HELRO|nr:hypothetical protein HELRODRAFT_157354 [Helobdella robusta]ESO00703.1 hypothetical protein HELRODRAFT_157354 [Helobdella robusta]
MVGNGGVGKTSLVVSYISNGFPSEYIPTAFDKYSVLITINGEPYDLHICDTAGQSDFDILRPFCYPSVDVFVLCYSVISPTSMKDIRMKWIKEVRLINQLVPVVLVGTQQDLRNDVKVLLDLAKYGQKPVSEEEGRSLAKEIGAIGYMECSALTQKNLKETFDVVVGSGLNESRRRCG